MRQASLSFLISGKCFISSSGIKPPSKPSREIKQTIVYTHLRDEMTHMSLCIQALLSDAKRLTAALWPRL